LYRLLKSSGPVPYRLRFALPSRNDGNSPIVYFLSVRNIAFQPRHNHLFPGFPRFCLSAECMRSSHYQTALGLLRFVDFFSGQVAFRKNNMLEKHCGRTRHVLPGSRRNLPMGPFTAMRARLGALFLREKSAGIGHFKTQQRQTRAKGSRGTDD